MSYQVEGGFTRMGGAVDPGHFLAHAGKTHNGDMGDVADDHFHRDKEDIGPMTDLWSDDVPFSIAWPRSFLRDRCA